MFHSLLLCYCPFKRVSVFPGKVSAHGVVGVFGLLETHVESLVLDEGLTEKKTCIRGCRKQQYWLLTSTSTLQQKKQPSTSDGGASHHINMYCMYFTEKGKANAHHSGGGFSPLLSGREAVAMCTHSHPLACTHGWTGFVYKRLERAQNHNRGEV